MEPVPQGKALVPEVAKAAAELPETSRESLVERVKARVRERDVVKDKDRAKADEKARSRAWEEAVLARTTEPNNSGGFLY
jgi:hypothetical protein